jgi:ABC-type branched-subunit amino acid transport system substrate-binding protein
MKKIFVVFIAGLIIVSIPSADAKISVGVICSMTGHYAIDGNEIFRTKDLFIQLQNKEIDVDICDDGSTLQQAISCADTLVYKMKPIAIIGPSFSSAAEHVREILAKVGTPHISLAPERPDYEARPRTFFRIGTSTGRLISKAVEFVVNNLKPKNLGVMLDNNLLAPSASWKSVFSDNSALNFQQFLPDTKDLPTELRKSNTDVLLLRYQYLSKIIPLLQNFRNLIALTYASIGIGQLEKLKNDRLYIVATPIPNTQEGAIFSGNFQGKYGIPPNAGFAFQTYAALEILADVTKRLKAEATPEKIVDMIQKSTFSTVLGSIRFNEAGDSNWTSEAVYNIRAEGPPVVAFAGKTDCSCNLADCCKIECCKKKSCEGKCPTE